MENQLPRQVAANPTQYNIDASQTISVGADGSEFPGIHGGRGEGGGTPGEGEWLLDVLVQLFVSSVPPKPRRSETHSTPESPTRRSCR
jgi:hypothetical protein